MNDTIGLLPDIKLRFNIEHPNLEECYLHGYECAQTEISEESNPHAVGTSAYEQWNEGWWAGFYGEKPIFDLDAEEEKDSFAANDHVYQEGLDNFFVRLLEISGVIAVSALVGYQLIELVA